MPRFAVGLSETGQRVGQRSVHRSSLLPGGGLVDRRAHEWVSHLHLLCLGDEESGGHGGLESLLAHAECRCCMAYDGELAGVVGSREQQH